MLCITDITFETLMKIVLRLFVTLVLLSLTSACGEKNNGSTAGILDEISGVWRAKNDGTMISIIYAEKKVRLLFGDNAPPVSLGEVDNTNKTANMNVTLNNGKTARGQFVKFGTTTRPAFTFN